MAQPSVEQLTDREKNILAAVIRCFIRSATPVASEHLARNFFANLSPATIRNVLADLETKGFINHPHTSAGRVPTDSGYRVYVDNLMRVSHLSQAEKRKIKQRVLSAGDADELLKELSRILGKISRQLCVISFPHLSAGILERMELVSLSSSRVLVVLTLKSGLVKTITMEVASEVPRQKLELIARLLNERIAGLTLLQIRETFAERLKDAVDEDTGLIRLFLTSKERLFDDIRERERVYISGSQQIAEQPEFSKPEHYRNLLAIIDDEHLLTAALDQSFTHKDEGTVTVKIGSENRYKEFKDYSIVTASYFIGDVEGSIGIIGPRRMNYERTVPLVDYAAQAVTDSLS